LHFSQLVRGADQNRQRVGRGLCEQARGGALLQAAVDLWLWAQQNLLSLRALHIPGAQNVGADLMSCRGLCQEEWRLHPDIVRLIWRRFGMAQVDQGERPLQDVDLSLPARWSPVGGRCDGACSMATDAFVCATAADPPSSGEGLTGVSVADSGGAGE